MQADPRAGRRIRVVVPGYLGSPLGGRDLEIAQRPELRKVLRVAHMRAIIEEPRATAAWAPLPGRRRTALATSAPCEAVRKTKGGPESFDPSPPLMRVR